MTRVAAGRVLGALALLTLPALVALGPAGADHGCPWFERRPYDLTFDQHLGGDLYAVEHRVGFVDFRECHELRHRVTHVEVRLEARGGAYLVRVAGEGFDEAATLREGANATRWYDARRVEMLQFAGLAADGTPAADLGLADPPLPPPRRAWALPAPGMR